MATLIAIVRTAMTCVLTLGASTHTLHVRAFGTSEPQAGLGSTSEPAAGTVVCTESACGPHSSCRVDAALSEARHAPY